MNCLFCKQEIADIAKCCRYLWLKAYHAMAVVMKRGRSERRVLCGVRHALANANLYGA